MPLYHKNTKLSKNARLAFIFSYYEFNRFNDVEFEKCMRRILTLNRHFMDSFFNKNDLKEKKDELLAYVNVNDQKIELKTDWNQNGIYTGFLNYQANLAILELAEFESLELCVINFDGYSKELVDFWTKFCSILRAKKSLQSLHLRSTSMPIAFLLEQLPLQKIVSLEIDNFNYPLHELEMRMDNLCLYSYGGLPNYSQLLKFPSRRIEIQQSNWCSGQFVDLHKCIPFFFNPSLERLCINVDFELNLKNFENETWEDRFELKYMQIFEELRKVNNRMILEVPEYSSVSYSLKSLDDALQAHYSLLNNIKSFIDLSDSIQVFITKLTTYNTIPAQSFNDQFVQTLSQQLGMHQSTKNTSMLYGKFEYKDNWFLLEHNYLSTV